MGSQSLLAALGFGNTALGYAALNANTGSENTALGTDALAYSVAGNGNTAIGSGAHYWGNEGSQNTAIGYVALFYNVGTGNTGTGEHALFGTGYGVTGTNNTAAGQGALRTDQTGSNNTAFGVSALQNSDDGYGNAAQGFNALFANTRGFRNLGIGSDALYNNVSGSYNIALGFSAGSNVTTGNDNVHLANLGNAGESQSMHLGMEGTPGSSGSGITAAYLAGIAQSQVTGSAVYITSSGQLGVLASAERFKTNIAPMQGVSQKISELHPVTFRLKTGSQDTQQYGLNAEQVAKVYPEMVIHGTDGNIAGVRYEELAPLLLGELTQLQRELVELRQLKKSFDTQLSTSPNINRVVIR